MSTEQSSGDAPSRRSRRLPIAVLAGACGVVAIGVFMMARASAHVNKVALASMPKGVTVVLAKAAQYRPSRRYVGTIQPWMEAKIGPQLISGYVDTVLVRPGDAVKRGQIIATIDCRNASASSKAVAMQARALQAEQEAIAHESARVAELKQGGFASPERDRKTRGGQRQQDGRADGDAGEDAAGDAGSERLHSAGAVRGRDRGARCRSRRLRPSRHRGGDPRRPNDGPHRGRGPGS